MTTRTASRAFYLAGDIEKRRLASALAFYRAKGDLRLFAYVIMDNHIHAVMQLSGEASLSDIVRNLKRWSSRRNTLKPGGAPMWERTYDDNQIRTVEELRRVISYIHENPVRSALVRNAEEYFWSSARNYAGAAPTAMDVDMDWD